MTSLLHYSSGKGPRRERRKVSPDVGAGVQERDGHAAPEGAQGVYYIINFDHYISLHYILIITLG